LPEGVALDEERVARFKREARALGALNHPHIAALFGMKEAGGRHFLVMELVEGETLEERLLSDLPIEEALQIARQIAEALEAAHEKGIIHRDLKPANVKITPGDKVKVLDFGLAKAMEGPGETDGRTDSVTHTVMGTQAGVILGTVAYMSPEQARAKPVDRRADIWAFGCVLYEMLTGKRAFATGESVPDAIAAILTGEVDWSALQPDTPPRIRTLLRRCLQKDPQKRLPHIGVARLEIDDASVDLRTAPGVSPAPLRLAPWWKRPAFMVVVASIAGALAANAAWMLAPRSAPITTRFSIVLPDGDAFTNTDRQAIAISPDARHIVYVANRRLYVRAVWDQDPRAIAGTDHDQGVFHPVFSPDDRSLAFVAGPEVKRIALTGGTAATVASISGGVYGMSWIGDHLVFGEGGTRIVRVPIAGGTPQVLVSVEAPEGVSSPSILPDGNHLLFTHARLISPAERWTRAHVVVQSLETGERRIVVDGGADGRYLASGQLVYAVGGVVYGASFDVDRLAIRGTPAPLIEGVRRGAPTGAAQFAVSTTGSLAYLPGTPSSPLESELFLTDPKGSTVWLNVRGGQYEQPRLSPDGRQVAFGSVDPATSQRVGLRAVRFECDATADDRRQ
jgi:eukaryotic-like serine/threonine-protein kinase